MVDHQEGININNLQEQLTALCNTKDIMPEIKQTKRGTVYDIKKNKAHIEITLGTEWIGYSLALDKTVLNGELVVLEDTDNYKLGGENTDISRAIYSNAIAYFKGVVDGSMLVGVEGSKRYIVVCISDDKCRVFVKGRFLSTVKYISEDKVRNLDFLKPLKSI